MLLRKDRVEIGNAGSAVCRKILKTASFFFSLFAFLTLAIILAQTQKSVAPGHDLRTQSTSVSATEKLSQKAPSDVSEAKRQQVVKDYGNLPLSFEANQGQTDDRVKFLARGNGYTLFLTSTEAVLSLRKSDSSEGRDAGIRRLGDAWIVSAHQDLQSTIRNRQSAVLRMKLIGANPAPRVLGLEELPAKDNYFIGSDPKKWHTDVSSYGKVRYQDVYPGVDLVYYGNQRQLEHDFVVVAGADPKTIELQVQGARALRIDDQGELVLETRGEEVRLLKPHIYQEVKGALDEQRVRGQLEGLTAMRLQAEGVPDPADGHAA